MTRSRLPIANRIVQILTPGSSPGNPSGITNWSTLQGKIGNVNLVFQYMQDADVASAFVSTNARFKAIM